MRKQMLIILLISSINSITAQTITVNEPEICFQCHAEMEDLSNKKHVHTAFEAGVCSDCHNPHATKHASLLYEDVNNLCVTCHDNFEDIVTNEKSHKPVRNGKCLSCHDPHASENSGILSVSSEDICSSCHANVDKWKTEEFIHEPVAEGVCQTCHDPHLGKSEKLLDSTVPEMCFDCHTIDNQFMTSHKGKGEDLSKSNCITCHDPHASSIKGLIMPNQHRPFSGGQCKTCHKTEQGILSFAINDEPKKLCVKCHSDVTSEMNKEYDHILNEELSCLNCHNPHASSTNALLVKEQKLMCANCHFNDHPKKTQEELLTHKTTDCSACHTPHGADNKEYLKVSGLELCKDCHAGAHSNTHPIGEEIIDPRTEEMMTCLSCHQLHGADFEKYLPLNPRMELCIQCHKR